MYLWICNTVIIHHSLFSLARQDFGKNSWYDIWWDISNNLHITLLSYCTYSMIWQLTGRQTLDASLQWLSHIRCHTPSPWRTYPSIYRVLDSGFGSELLYRERELIAVSFDYWELATVIACRVPQDKVKLQLPQRSSTASGTAPGPVVIDIYTVYYYSYWDRICAVRLCVSSPIDSSTPKQMQKDM